MADVYSPLTFGTEVKLIYTLDTKILIQRYQAEISMDVSRYFSGLSHIQIYQCQRSGLQFYYPLTLAGDADFYAQLSKNYKGYYSPWKWEHSKVYEYIKPDMNVLEVGCGYGYFLQKIQQSGCSCVGLELNEDAIAYGQEHQIPIVNEDLSIHAEKYAGTYDVVCAFQVYEHVSQVRAMLEQATACLKKGGILALGVPNNDSYLFRKDLYHTLNLPPHHTLRWNPASLAFLPEILPLEVVAIATEPANTIHRSLAYRLFLKNALKSQALTTLIHTLTRPLVKQLPVLNEGATVVGLFRKL